MFIKDIRRCMEKGCCNIVEVANVKRSIIGLKKQPINGTSTKTLCIVTKTKADEKTMIQELA